MNKCINAENHYIVKRRIDLRFYSLYMQRSVFVMCQCLTGCKNIKMV